MSRIGFFQDILSSVFFFSAVPSEKSDSRSFEELCHALLSERGEVSGNRIANTILTRFAAANDEERLVFFNLLIKQFDLDTQQVQDAAKALAEDNSPKNLSHLLNCAEPDRQELFKRLNRVPGATGELVNMRAFLLSKLKEHPELERIDIDFQRLFRAWFIRGFLVLKDIDWQTPANVLEKLIEYEAVHEITSWGALRRRLEPTDRKCFAFFHPTMLDEPLIFVEVALSKSLPCSIGDVLSEDRTELPAEVADTAVFYSISNCQKGLAGVSFGNFLIKQVAQELSSQLPNLKTFRTLSPVPGFMRWVHKELETVANTAAQTDDNAETARRANLAIVKKVSDNAIATPNKEEQRRLSEVAAHYLVNERRHDGHPLDPVARFHLGNGASLSKILPVADSYEKGLAQSAGVMVSYLYDLDKIISNHEAYASDNVVATTSEVVGLLKERKR